MTVRRKSSLAGRLRRGLFAIAAEEASFARRGFWPGEATARERLERAGGMFLLGYNAALEEGEPGATAGRLRDCADEWRGFAFEGAAMGLALLDRLAPWGGGRLRGFLEGPGASHVYMIHVGAGWAYARLRRLGTAAPFARLDPLLRWLAWDGYGFHEGYFQPSRYLRGQEAQAPPAGYAGRAFTQGLGRSMWFVNAADVGRVEANVASFPAWRRADLWSGVGLACAYAGGADRAGVEALRRAAGPYLTHLAQGAAFAAGARRRAANPTPHTELACRVFCGRTAEEAALVSEAAREHLPADAEAPAYEVWRRRIRIEFEREQSIVCG